MKAVGYAAALCVVVTFLFVTGCDRDQTAGAWSRDEVSQEAPPEGVPADFFPLATGTTWTYAITLGEAEPLGYEEITWKGPGGTGVLSAQRRRFTGVFEEHEGNQFTLKMRVKGPAPKQGGLEYPLGVELEILKDDLGIFYGAKQVFFAVANYDRFMAHLVVTHDANGPGAPSGSGPWSSWGSEDGYSMRLIFFGSAPGTRISMGSKPKDMLLFAGVEGTIEGGVDVLRFMRTVLPSDDPIDELLGEGFSEETWFEKDRGLVRLVQTRGSVTMTWNLTDFSQ